MRPLSDGATGTQYLTSTIVQLRDSALGGRFGLPIGLADGDGDGQSGAFDRMRTNLAARLEVLAPLLGSAFAFIVFFGWRW
jgi:hypothetical protein